MTASEIEFMEGTYAGSLYMVAAKLPGFRIGFKPEVSYPRNVGTLVIVRARFQCNGRPTSHFGHELHQKHPHVTFSTLAPDHASTCFVYAFDGIWRRGRVARVLSRDNVLSNCLDQFREALMGDHDWCVPKDVLVAAMMEKIIGMVLPDTETTLLDQCVLTLPDGTKAATDPDPIDPEED